MVDPSLMAALDRAAERETARAEAQARRRAAREAKQDVFSAEDVLRAGQRILELAESEDSSIALKASMAILDRKLGKPHQSSTVENVTHDDPNRMTDEDLVKLIEEEKQAH